MKRAQKKKYEYAAVCLPRDVKRKVRSVAAELETSIGRACQQLIEIGLAEYEHQQRQPSAEAKP